MPKEQSMPSTDKKWEIECDARKLTEAGEVLTDPKRLQAAVDFLKKREKGIESILELRQAADKAKGGTGDINVEDDSSEE